MKIESAENSPRSTGRRELIAHLKGQPITRAKAMAAKCFECCNGYKDGQNDCRVTDCPLYPWMPYGELSNKSDSTLNSTEVPL